MNLAVYGKHHLGSSAFPTQQQKGNNHPAGLRYPPHHTGSLSVWRGFEYKTRTGNKADCVALNFPIGNNPQRQYWQNMAQNETYYHGTKADLKEGDLIAPGYRSNYGSRKEALFVYLTQTVDAAVWGAELAVGEAPGRIYLVEPTGPIEDDPNLTDKKFPGNPTKSYRTKQPLRVVGELKEWQGHSEEQLATMRANLERLKALGIEAIEE